MLPQVKGLGSELREIPAIGGPVVQISASSSSKFGCCLQRISSLFQSQLWHQSKHVQAGVRKPIIGMIPIFGGDVRDVRGGSLPISPQSTSAHRSRNFVIIYFPGTYCTHNHQILG